MLLANVVIGSTIEAAYYAFLNDYYFIPNRKEPFMFYESSPIRLFGHDKKSDIWNKINVMLGLLSKRLSFENSASVKVLDDVIKIVSGNVVFKYKFQNLFIFDAIGIQIDNEIEKAHPTTFRVLDDFELSVLGPKQHNLDALYSESNFAKSLHYYCSGRVDGSDYITDCVVESELTYDQLNCLDYSDTMLRFVVERHLASLGVNGRLMSYYKSGRPKYRKPKVLHVSRSSYEIDNNIYKDTDNVKFLKLSLRDIVEEGTKR